MVSKPWVDRTPIVIVYSVRLIGEGAKIESSQPVVDCFIRVLIRPRAILAAVSVRRHDWCDS